MALTTIGYQKTPATPIEITFEAQTGLPSANQTLVLIGHMGATGGAPVSGVASGSAVPYVIKPIVNVADPLAGATEVNGYFGAGSELALMVIAAIQANYVDANSNFPNISCVPLAPSDTAWGPLNAAGVGAALAAASRVEAEFLVSPYDGNNQTLTTALIETAQGMSGPSNVQNGQFGTIAVAANQSVAGISATSLFKYDTQYFSGCSLPDSSGAAPQSLGALASAYAAILGGNLIPFNPVNGIVIGNIAAPVNQSDWITVGAGLESEAILGQGWTPLRVLPNGTVAIVRSVTARLTLNGNGVTPVLSYFDVQDFQVLYYFRRTVAARFAQPDFQNVKASSAAATNTKNVVVQLMSDFEDQNMFQNVAGLAPLVQVQRNATDRSRFDVFIPVNVIPGLDVIATNVQAGTIGDSFTV